VQNICPIYIYAERVGDKFRRGANYWLSHYRSLFNTSLLLAHA
jgi:hypothetical protein